MLTAALGSMFYGSGDVSESSRPLTTGRRITLAVLVLLHGFAHANAAIWASQAAPLWITTLFWSVAMLGYLGAGFGLLRVSLVRSHYRSLMTAATIASIALLTIIGGPIAFVGTLVDLVFLTIVVHWTRTHVGRSTVDSTPRRFPRLAAIGHVTGMLFLIYATVVTLFHPIYLHWGTTRGDRLMPMPGDGLVPDARYRVDHGVTIRAPADSVWPWLVQIGQDRGGFYSYTWLENLVGADIHNADRIHNEWQRLKAGDLVRATPPDYLGGRLGEPGWRVLDVVPGRAIVLENWGAFVLHPVDSMTTKFFVRTRGDGEPSLLSVLLGPVNLFVFEPAHFIMQRGMMLGIRDRAESMIELKGGRRI
jgi:hypothetical protein